MLCNVLPVETEPCLLTNTVNFYFNGFTSVPVVTAQQCSVLIEDTSRCHTNVNRPVASGITIFCDATGTKQSPSSGHCTVYKTMRVVTL